MENQLVWQDEYEIGVEVIDKEHRRLFKIINKLLAFGEEEKKNKRSCQEGIKYFKGHAVKHFAEEEEYMASIGYAEMKRHKRIHDDFRKNTLPVLEQELEQTGYAEEAMKHFLGVCTGWLVGHTLTEDQAIVGKGVSPWTGLLPEEEQEAIKKVIVQLVFDMFHLETQVLSDTYGGEKFGQGVYYRLSYGLPHTDQRQEVIMVFEEKLLIGTVGKVIGFQSNKLDSLLVHSARYMARHFSGRVMELLPEVKDFELQEENLLSYEQFQEIFSREKPQVSLLFNSSEGYFAYCTIAPHMLDKGVGTPLEHMNALDEVEKFLSTRSEQEKREAEAHKKKILVIDDSATIRQGMKQLLGEDYEVFLAESGASAFRTISLNQPDLVLLDYEMPICDGKQTLEMLRSVKEFEKIPVIFLTGRRDRESMIQVMPLNPAGYLLKYLKPEEIKRKVDEFMQKRGA